ncbi:MAG: MFS transporter [Pseudomonadota bacterium]
MKPHTNEDQSKNKWLVPALGLTQIISWGSMFYAYSVLMQPMQIALHTSKTTVVGAYSLALLISGCLSMLAGSIIDRFGGRMLMGVGSLLSGMMLLLLSHVQNITELYLVWAGIGVAMSATLYQPAFAVITQVFGSSYRKSITLLTLFGGLASTVSWPLTQALLVRYGWRETWEVYAIANLVLCLPIHAFLPSLNQTKSKPLHPSHGSQTLSLALRDPAFYLAASAFTFNALVFSAMSLHLISILQARGLSAAQATTIGAIIGPMQVIGRIIETTLGKNASSRQVGLIALWLLPIALCLLFAPAGWTVIYILFAMAYGMSNGVVTIVRGTLPAEMYGQEAYGAISGAMSTPVMLAIAAGSFIASVLYSLTGGYVGTLIVLIIMAILAAILFMTIRVPAQLSLKKL